MRSAACIDEVIDAGVRIDPVTVRVTKVAVLLVFTVNYFRFTFTASESELYATHRTKPTSAPRTARDVFHSARTCSCVSCGRASPAGKTHGVVRWTVWSCPHLLLKECSAPWSAPRAQSDASVMRSFATPKATISSAASVSLCRAPVLRWEHGGGEVQVGSSNSVSKLH